MKKTIIHGFLFVFVAMISSCGNRNIHVQTVDFQRDSVIERDKMEELIIEIFFIEASIYKAQIEGRDIQYYSNSYYDWFFAKHRINRRRILKSIEYYTSRKEMDEIMQNVVSKMMETDIKTTEDQQASKEEIIVPEQQTPGWIEKITEN